jgi:hypothetical protein
MEINYFDQQFTTGSSNISEFSGHNTNPEWRSQDFISPM